MNKTFISRKKILANSTSNQVTVRCAISSQHYWPTCYEDDNGRVITVMSGHYANIITTFLTDELATKFPQGFNKTAYFIKLGCQSMPYACFFIVTTSSRPVSKRLFQGGTQKAKCTLITRDQILMQMHIPFLQPKSTLNWIHVCITSFLKFQIQFDGAYKCIFCLFYE
jgi:hypothetical protein